MPDRAKKSARQRQERVRKKQNARRANAGSPYARIGAAGEPVACYVTPDYRERGLATLHVLRRDPRGGHATAGFLIDVWCLGLKQAWGRLDVTFDQFHENIRRCATMVPIGPDRARALVAGAIRFAHDNGFRLPRRYDRWVAFLGNVQDWRTADTSEFGVDGKLRYIGNAGDLQDRLERGTVKEFLERDDVEFVTAAMNPWANTSSSESQAKCTASDGLDADELSSRIEDAEAMMSRDTLSDIRRWCHETGRTPHPRLAEAVRRLLHMWVSTPGFSAPAVASSWLARGISASLERMLSEQPPADARSLEEALDQIGGYYAALSSNETEHPH